MEWTRGRTLGRGSTSTVYAAEHRRSGQVFAVKSAELHRSEFLKREQGILSKLNCPQIVAYQGCDVTLENGDHMFNLFMEYAPHGTLADHSNGGGIEEALVGSYTRQILLGLNYLHSKGIVHCDVKGQNVLVTEQEVIKIADFGCARRVEEESPMIAGTPAFMAPEVASGQKQGFAADVWALGCTMLEMITGKPPWRGFSDPAALLYRVGFSGDVPEVPSYVSEQGRDFLSKCLKRDPNERWSVGELLGHGFVGDRKESALDSDTPTSVLERGFWDSLETTTTTTQGPTPYCCSSSDSSSPRDRIRRLCADDDDEPVWEWGDDDGDQWVTVRSSNDEEELDHALCGSDPTVRVVLSDQESGSLIFYEPKIVAVVDTKVELMSRWNAIVDYCCLSRCCDREWLLVCQCPKIVPHGKFDSRNKEIFVMLCFLLSLCLFNPPLDEITLQFKVII